MGRARGITLYLYRQLSCKQKYIYSLVTTFKTREEFFLNKFENFFLYLGACWNTNLHTSYTNNIHGQLEIQILHNMYNYHDQEFYRQTAEILKFEFMKLIFHNNINTDLEISYYEGGRVFNFIIVYFLIIKTTLTKYKPYVFEYPLFSGLQYRKSTISIILLT